MTMAGTGNNGDLRHLLDGYCLNGDAYVYADELFKICKRANPALTDRAFQRELSEQIRSNRLAVEENRIYASNTLEYENFTASRLAALKSMPDLAPIKLPSIEMLAPLCQEQKEAAEMALSNRISLILGGGGTGKTTLIRAILSHGNCKYPVLCAPTGKAARNLTERLGVPARTVHSALGLCPDDDFLDSVQWQYVDTIIIDEASMLTLEMFAGILSKLVLCPDSHIILLGDPNQLLSVGTGNIIPDLLQLGFPCYMLRKNHRQQSRDSALFHNVSRFSELRGLNDMKFDDTFRLIEGSASALRDDLVATASFLYWSGASVQVLSPLKTKTSMSVLELNKAIQQELNPPSPDRLELWHNTKCFRDGDRVIILQNDRDNNCCNGDVGIFRVLSSMVRHEAYKVLMPDGRSPTWRGLNSLENLDLAYALTVHKSQGSEWDTILMPVIDGFQTMLTRNLFYTAISRAKKQIIMFGNRNAVASALERNPRKRRSLLTTKSNWYDKQ